MTLNDAMNEVYNRESILLASCQNNFEVTSYVLLVTSNCNKLLFKSN